MVVDRIIEKNVCSNCKYSFDDYSTGKWQNGCIKGSKAVNKDGGLTECYWWCCNG